MKSFNITIHGIEKDLVMDNHSVAAKEEKLTLLLQYADNWSGFIIKEDK